MCELILSVMIVGAMEVSPGTMQVEYMRSWDSTGSGQASVSQVHLPTSDYLECWDGPA